MTFKELEPVVLKRDHPEAGVCAGDLGTVVARYHGTDGLEVEFFRANGATKAVVTLSSRDVRKVRSSEVVAVRTP
jgi:hypothetical protein